MTPTMKRILKSWLLAAALCFCVTAAAERPVLIHSHNDYCRRAPFWQAYAQGVYSIEADVFLHDGKLLVGHDVEDLSPDMTFESLYVEPIVTLFKRNGGRAWKDSDEQLQLMVELKSATEPTLQAVTALLGRYPEVFDPTVNPEAVRIAVTGRVPAPADFGKYPAYVRFDGNWEVDYTPAQLERIALVSADFKDYSQWNGKGSIIPVERVKLEKIIDRAHGWGKPVRFWGAPEGTTVYYTFYDMGIDYINTDHPKYNPLGRYWQGGVWPGTNYMTIDGLYRKGYHDLAREIAANHYAAVFEVWKSTGTFWEYYAPEKIEPGFMARKDFVGWTGLPPIAVFIEYILGVKSDYSEGRIVWDIEHTEAHGIERYPYGPDGVVGLKVKRRASAGEMPSVSVETNVPFDLTVTWGDGRSRTVRVEKSGSVKLN